MIKRSRKCDQPAVAVSVPPPQKGMKRMMSVVAVLVAGVMLTGCNLTRTPYEQPDVLIPQSWGNSAEVEPQSLSMLESNDRWWELFSDTDLSALVELAFERNNDLAVAALRVRQTQLQAGLAQSDLWPDVSANVSGSGRRALDSSDNWARSSGTSVNLSYEVDLWGRLASLKDAADWEALATEADREAAALALAGTVSDLYWKLAFLNQQIASTQESIAYAEKTFELVQVQYDAGAVSSLEPTQARQAVLTQRSNLSELVQQRIETRNALSILFDLPPAEESLLLILPQEPLMLSHGALPEVYEGVPADVLARRPDLRAAEMRLRESLASMDATRVSYYPKLSLTGALGTSSSSLGNLLANPIGTLGAGLVLPFIQFNEMRFNTEIARLRYEEAAVNFRQTLYKAFLDVENVLSAREQLNEQNLLLQQALDDALKVEFIYEERYHTGSIELKDWLDAQESRRRAQISLSSNQLQRLQNQVKIYQALGGGI